jgi:cytidine deaminase
MKNAEYLALDAISKRLLDEAEKAMTTPYNPYSHFYVGAALLAKNGQIIAGSNVENAAYGSSICAERAAILHANVKGIRTFDKVAIITKGENFDTTDVSGPCGACRQMLYESAQLSGTNLEIIMSNTRKDKIVVATIEELLPLAFGPKDVGVDIRRYQ